MKKYTSMIEAMKCIDALREETYKSLCDHLIGKTAIYVKYNLECTITTVTVHEYLYVVSVGIQTVKYNTVVYIDELDINE